MPLLTVRAIEAYKPIEKAFKVTLDRGLQLRIAPDGARTLLVRYTVKGSSTERQYRLPQQYGEGAGQVKLAAAWPFAGPQAVLAYPSRYTHRVAISNRRLIAMDEHGVTFGWKDYRAKQRTRYKAMTLEPGEFMRRFLLHVLPGGLHRIRHYGLLANGSRKASLALARELLCEPSPAPVPADGEDPGIKQPTFVCMHCGCAMIVLQSFKRGQPIRAPPTP